MSKAVAMAMLVLSIASPCGAAAARELGNDPGRDPAQRPMTHLASEPSPACAQRAIEGPSDAPGVAPAQGPESQINGVLMSEQGEDPLKGGSGAAQAPIEHEPQTQDSGEAQAATRAVNALAEQLGIAPAEIVAVRIEPRTWNDSSMGCRRQPGSVALTVITEGYAVFLSVGGRQHEVHVSEASVAVCDPMLLRRDPRGATNARGLDILMERARQDLAQRLGVDPATVRLAGMQPQRWSDSGLDCPRPGETLRPGPINGFKLALRHDGRTYTYHTDRQSLRPCPEIESQ